MKRFVIKPPPNGRRTVTLVTHHYVDRAEATANGEDRGTKTTYLGSFRIDLDPDRLNGVQCISAGEVKCGIKLRPGTHAAGEPFVLNEDDLVEIRAWLTVHGTCVKERERLARWREERERQRVELRATLAAQIEAELRSRLMGEIRVQVEAEFASRKVCPLDQAVEELRDAGQVVRDEAARLKASGQRFATRRKLGADGKGASAQDELLERTLRLRKVAFADFEEACKAAGLMARKSASKRNRSAAVDSNHAVRKTRAPAGG